MQKVDATSFYKVTSQLNDNEGEPYVVAFEGSVEFWWADDMLGYIVTLNGEVGYYLDFFNPICGEFYFDGK